MNRHDIASQLNPPMPLSKAVTNLSKLTRIWASLVPGTVVKLGQRYLVAHDAGERARSLLAASLSSLIEAGVRVVVSNPGQSPLLNSTLSTDLRFEKWEEQGKLVKVETNFTDNQANERASESLRQPAAGTVYVVELLDGKLNRVTSVFGERAKKLPNTTGLFLVDRGKVAGPQLAQFLQRNKDVQFVDLSTPKTPFSSMLNVNHSKLQGTTTLLEYVSGSNIEETVERFFTEAAYYGKLCALFTSKSTRLYKTIKANKAVKIVAASPLVLQHNELPDGEVEIPDRELGLVTLIVSDLIESAKGLSACFVFDSMTELIRGERWEQVYSGVKQIVELVAQPNITTLLLANRDALDPRLVGALLGVIPAHMKLDRTGLQATKLAS